MKIFIYLSFNIHNKGPTTKIIIKKKTKKRQNAIILYSYPIIGVSELTGCFPQLEAPCSKKRHRN